MALKSQESGSFIAPLLNVDRDFDSVGNPSSSKPSNDQDGVSNYFSAPSFSSPATGSVEIKEEEMELSSAAICRICLEHDSDSGDELIAPCMCRGTNQFVHRSCLDHWRSVKEGFAFAHCTTCTAQYHLSINFLESSCWRNIKFRMFVARDIFLVFLAVQTTISILGGLSYLCDHDGRFRRSFIHNWDRIFANHPIFFYYCLGALIFFALLGIFGLLSQCKSYSPIDSRGGYNRSSSTQPVYCCNGPCVIDCPGSNSDDTAGLLAVVLVVVIIFAVIGIFYGIVVGTIGIQRIWQSHYHILTKRELTKEYVVEDLHGLYTPPRLDSEHAERLSTLKLL